MSPTEQARAYDFVADWHDRQAALFRAMSNDEPRTEAAGRKRAGEAAIHHAASAAALRIRASDTRRADAHSKNPPEAEHG